MPYRHHAQQGDQPEWPDRAAIGFSGWLCQLQVHVYIECAVKNSQDVYNILFLPPQVRYAIVTIQKNSYSPSASMRCVWPISGNWRSVCALV
jgi:hypothetical protein